MCKARHRSTPPDPAGRTLNGIGSLRTGYLIETHTYVTVEVADDCDAITRVTGEGGDEWRSHYYNFATEQDVLEHFAYNAIANGVEDANRLDGWADLPDGAVTMLVTEVNVWP